MSTPHLYNHITDLLFKCEVSTQVKFQEIYCVATLLLLDAILLNLIHCHVAAWLQERY